jgi:hypothetical protein
MQYLFVTILCALALLATACKSSQNDPFSPSVTTPRRVVTQVVNPPNNPPENPQPRPANILNGRIVAVREPLRFVIIDFAGGRMPLLDQQLNVYRLDQKVAELKISGPYLGTTVAADVIAGEAMPGDLVRDK